MLGPYLQACWISYAWPLPSGMLNKLCLALTFRHVEYLMLGPYLQACWISYAWPLPSGMFNKLCLALTFRHVEYLMLGPYLQACWISYAFESWTATELGVANKSRGNIFPNAKRRRWGQTVRYKTLVWIGIKSKRLLHFYSFVRGQCKVHKNLKYTAKNE